MKHTDFYNLHKKLDELAREELIDAVRAHGCEYTFIHFDENGDYDIKERDRAPIIMAGTYSMDNYEDFYISRVKLHDDCSLRIYGWLKEGWAYEIELDCIATGHWEYIIDEIPETEDVHDVREILSENEKPILVLSREDVEAVGYDSNMTDSQFQSLAWAMTKAYEFNTDIYWDALRQACENLGIEPLNLDGKNEED